jgi:membrane-bound lytic murein transglycosylase B
MHRRRKRTTAAVAAIALLALAGCGAQQASSTSATGTAAAAPQAGGPRGMLSAASLKTLAGKLGVSTTRLQSAMDKTRPDPASGQRPTGDRATALAKELGLSAAKVRAAMEAAGIGGGPRGAPPGGAAPPNGAAPSQGTTPS